MSYNKALVESARSLVLDQVKSAFLGAEVTEKSEEEASLDMAWKALGRGELAAAIEACSDLMERQKHNDDRKQRRNKERDQDRMQKDRERADREMRENGQVTVEEA